MKAILVMFDSLNRHMLGPYGCNGVATPNFDRLARHGVTFDHAYIGSMPCMPARRELHTGRYNFLHRSWGPLEPFDFSMPRQLDAAGIHTHLITDHHHYSKAGGHNYHTQYTTWEFIRGQSGDNWIAEVEPFGGDAELPNLHDRRSDAYRQDRVNRTVAKMEADWPQARCFQAGLEFLERNHAKEDWFLQIETFDPHEPFFAPEIYRRLQRCGSREEGAYYDWPAYVPATESEEERDKVRKEYAALLTMCDAQLGRVLDFMNLHEMWDDTMLIVNTDHGFLLAEHGWWGKGAMPWYQELAHIPLFISDPRADCDGERRSSLVQTIDLAPTILDFFGQDIPKEMQGHSLTATVEKDQPVREYALFGRHGDHVNLTDGQHVYMRGVDDLSAAPAVHEYTMMSSKYNNGVLAADEWNEMEIVGPFDFTGPYKVLKIPSRRQGRCAPEILGTHYLFDLDHDPGQRENLAGRTPELEATLQREMVRLMEESCAPAEIYDRLGLQRV